VLFGHGEIGVMNTTEEEEEEGCRGKDLVLFGFLSCSRGHLQLLI